MRNAVALNPSNAVGAEIKMDMMASNVKAKRTMEKNKYVQEDSPVFIMNTVLFERDCIPYMCEFEIDASEKNARLHF